MNMAHSYAWINNTAIKINWMCIYHHGEREQKHTMKEKKVTEEVQPNSTCVRF